MAVKSLNKNSSKRVVVFTNDDRDTQQSFVDALSHELKQPAETLVLKDAVEIDDYSLLVVDCACYTPNRIQGWLNALDTNAIPPVALYNTEPSSLHETLLEWPCVKGFFFHDTDLKQLIEGLKLMLEGDFWVPRRLLHAYLERNRRPPTHQIKAQELLTKREREILQHLENGATNAALAEAMKVSEHTIKTHLYNIYKKIDVANRIEAINWSRQNISVRGL